MADTEQPQFTTLAERIAALNQQKSFAVNANAPGSKRPPPPPPPIKHGSSVVKSNQATPTPPPRPNRPPLPARQNTQTSVQEQPSQPTARPPLPSRASTMQLQQQQQQPQQTPPTLPRRQTAQPNGFLSTRRNSASSEMSQSSAISSLSLGRTASSTTSQSSAGTAQYKLPPRLDMAQLPPLPPTRREREAQAQQEAERQAHEAKEHKETDRLTGSPAARAVPVPPARPGLPPRAPSRPTRSNTASPALTATQEPVSAPTRRLPPVANRTAPITGFGSGREDRPPALPTTSRNSEPPPVPMKSRPSAAEIQAVNTRSTVSTSKPDSECWVCKDWSLPDKAGSMFPRQNLPRNDPVGYLATHLCSQFPSYTDKARAIFSWCHHNIAYDCHSFFSNNVKAVSPADVILSGLAVCSGYAGAYEAIAVRAGLECVSINGHGKGFGYKPLKEGERPPAIPEINHAWNAVRIDGGVWKVLDSCWGAGNVSDQTNEFTKDYKPNEFILSNEEIGQRHFPENPQYQFRSDGRTISWEEYMIGEGVFERPTAYTDFNTEGFLEKSLEPKEKKISVYSGQVVRFQWSRLCPHWTLKMSGHSKEPLLLLKINGQDGRKDDMVPIQTDGHWFWVDVNARDLGAPGQTISVVSITTVSDQSARGMTAAEFLPKRGKCGMSWSGVVQWELV